MSCVLCGVQIMMSAEEPQVSNVRERAGQRPILSSLLGALGEPQPPAAPGVATQVIQGQLRASEERFREEIALHERDRSTHGIQRITLCYVLVPLPLVYQCIPPVYITSVYYQYKEFMLDISLRLFPLETGYKFISIQHF